uniref:(northern house mosquito) hypothetical protein n=1 Tax=Culex pipiens TaxID=7175 RepID=A0A8D8AU89_CULPI
MLILVLFVGVLLLTVEALLGPIDNQPCSKITNNLDPAVSFHKQGRVVAMVFDDHGHSPFNFYDQMSNDGGCIQVTVSMSRQVLNVTVACEGTEDSAAQDLDCPTWKGTQQKWRASNVAVRSQLDHLAVDGCIELNETHKIYGSLQIGQPVMIKKKIESRPGAVEFSEQRQCRCRFRNEFVIDLSDGANVERGSLGYCHWHWNRHSWVVIYVSSVVGLFSIGLSAYVVIRLTLWRIIASYRTGMA